MPSRSRNITRRANANARGHAATANAAAPAPGLFGRVGLAFKSALRSMLFSPFGAGYGYGDSSYGGLGGWFGTILGLDGTTPYDYANHSGDPHTNVAVSACLRTLRTNVTEPELEVVEKDDEGDEIPIPGHPALGLLDRPNDWYGFAELIGQVYTTAKVDGNAFVIIIRSGAGIPSELWWVPTWTMAPWWPEGDGSTFIERWKYCPDGGSTIRDIDPRDVIWFKHGRQDETRYGGRLWSSPLRDAAARTICSLNEVEAFTATILRHGGVPPIVIKPLPGAIPPDENDAERMTRDYRSLFDNERRGDPFIATGPFDVSVLGYSPEQLSLTTLPARLEDIVCAELGVPAQVVGLSSGGLHKTYENYKVARESFYQETLVPDCKVIARTLTDALIGQPGMGEGGGKQRLKFNWDNVAGLQEDAGAKADRVIKLQAAMIFTRADARRELGLDADDADDLYMVPRGVQFLRVGEAVPPYAPPFPVNGPPVVPGTLAPGDATPDMVADDDVSGRRVAEPEAEAAPGPGDAAKPKPPAPAKPGGKPAKKGNAVLPDSKNCGTGHGGFQPGNTCQPHGGGGGGGGGGSHSGTGSSSSGGASSFTVAGEEFTPERVEAIQSAVAMQGKFVGEDWSLSLKVASTPAELKAIEATQEHNRFLIRSTFTPYAESSKSGDVTTHTVGGHVVAETMPGTAESAANFRADSAHWISRQHSEVVGQKPDDWGPYKSEAKAEKASADWAQYQVKRGTDRETGKPKDLGTYFAGRAASYEAGSAAKVTGKIDFSWIVPVGVDLSSFKAMGKVVAPEGEDGGGPFPEIEAKANEPGATAESPAPGLADARALLAEAAANAGVDLDGESVTPADRRSVLHALIAIAEERLRADAEELRASLGGDGTKGLLGSAAAKVAAWKDRTAKYLKSAFLAAALALTDPLTPADLARLDAAVQVQEGYLDGFADAVISEDQASDTDGLAARAGSYSASIWAGAENVAYGHAKDAGMQQARRVIDDSALHCEQCPELASLGWVGIQDFVEIGETTCSYKCRCYAEYQ